MKKDDLLKQLKKAYSSTSTDYNKLLNQLNLMNDSEYSELITDILYSNHFAYLPKFKYIIGYDNQNVLSFIFNGMPINLGFYQDYHGIRTNFLIKLLCFSDDDFFCFKDNENYLVAAVIEFKYYFIPNRLYLINADFINSKNISNELYEKISINAINHIMKDSKILLRDKKFRGLV